MNMRRILTLSTLLLMLCAVGAPTGGYAAEMKTEDWHLFSDTWKRVNMATSTGKVTGVFCE